MKRRDFLTHSALTAGAALALGSWEKMAFAAEKKASHGHYAGGNQAMQQKASDCVNKGELCLQHCLGRLSKGDKSMAECAGSVRELLVYCGALAKASAQNSKHLRELAALSAAVCKECEDACGKHKEMAVCRDCAEACAACAEECSSLRA